MCPNQRDTDSWHNLANLFNGIQRTWHFREVYSSRNVQRERRANGVQPSRIERSGIYRRTRWSVGSLFSAQAEVIALFV